AELEHDLGVVAGSLGQRQGGVTPVLAARLVGHFRRALDSEPGHVVAGLSLAEALRLAGRQDEAITQARATLADLERQADLDPRLLDAGRFPGGFDLFRIEWERAAWDNAGRPTVQAQAKRRLLRCRLHTLLAELTGELSHYHEAA